MNIKTLLVGGSILAGFLLSATAYATSPSGCSVSRVTSIGTVYYVPSGGPGSYNLLGWGNGTGGGSTTYRGLLEAAAEECVLVAAATTASAGDGSAVASSVNSAKSRYASRLRSNTKVCTSGHSQGGGGAFNAANRLGADCVTAPLTGADVETAALSRLYFLGLLDPEERQPVLAHIAARIEADLDRLTALDERLETVEIPAGYEDVAASQRATLDYGLASQRFALEWFRDLADRYAVGD